MLGSERKIGLALNDCSVGLNFDFDFDLDFGESSFDEPFFPGVNEIWRRCEMSTHRQQVAVRDLVEEAKKRIVVLAICVVGLSYLMSCKFFDYFPSNFVI